MSYCNKCGTQNKDGAVYCSGCGELISGSSNAQQPAAAPAPSPQPSNDDSKKKSRKLIYIVAAILVIVVVIAIAVTVINNMDPNWSSSAADSLKDEGYDGVQILNCDVEKGKNGLGWDIAKVTGTFTYGGSATVHEYSILCRHMDNNWYILWTHVDGDI